MARRAGRGLVAITCCLTALCAGFGRASAATSDTAAAPIPRAWIVADARTGEILDAHDDHTPYPPASTTKIMTALTALQRLPPDASITVSALAASQPASRIGMREGERWSLLDALSSLMVVSANDAAFAIAESTSGTVADFAKAEAATGRQLGLRDSTFADPSGLDDGNSFGGGPRMSAFDIAVTTRNALKVPVLARLAASSRIEFTGPDGVDHTLINHNRLVTNGLYSGATGFKTGYTDQALHTLVATATRNGRSLIVVVLGTWDAYGWASRLLDVGFAKQPGQGTGQSLPPTRITTYSWRAEQFAAMRRLASSSVSTSSPQVQPTATNGVAAAPAAGNPAAENPAADKKGSGGISTKTLVILLLVLVLATLYVLRVRAVKRARARRLARRRAARNMMRRGGLPIVDGRYRTGTRVGKPVESHVQIRRDHESERRASGSG
jgi:D-alanyl-D-alanine carboxypeptidase